MEASDPNAWLTAPIAPPLPPEGPERDAFGRQVLDACQRKAPHSLRRLLPFRHLASVNTRVWLVRRCRPSPMYARDLLLEWLAPFDADLVRATSGGGDAWASGADAELERLLGLVRLAALAELGQSPDETDAQLVRDDLGGHAHAQPELTCRALRAFPEADRSPLIRTALERRQTLALHVLPATDDGVCHQLALTLALGLPKPPPHEPTLTSALVRAGDPMTLPLVALLEEGRDLTPASHALVLGAATERALRHEGTARETPLPRTIEAWAEAALLTGRKAVRLAGVRALCRIAPRQTAGLEALAKARKKAVREAATFALSVRDHVSADEAVATITTFEPARPTQSVARLDGFVHTRRTSTQLPWSLAFAFAALPLPNDFRARLTGALMHPHGASAEVREEAKKVGTWLVRAPHGLAPRRVVEWAPKPRKPRKARKPRKD